MTRLDLPATDLANLLTRYQEAHNELAQRTARIQSARDALLSLCDHLKSNRLPETMVDGSRFSDDFAVRQSPHP